MNPAKKYFGITFGPIDRVLSYSKSTRSIWASSYFFSDLAKRIVSPLFWGKCRFLKPAMREDMFSPSMIGVFPDQYVFEGTGEFSSLGALRELCDGVLKDLGHRMIECLGLKDISEDQMLEFLRRKIKIYVVGFESDAPDEEVVRAVQSMMTVAECRDTFPDVENRNYLECLFAKEIPDLKRFFGLDSLVRFDSLPEVASHRYVVFVNADGDNFGKTLALRPELSGRFQGFSVVLRKEVNAYGGQVFYQGGDDVSFYVPLFNGKKDVFCLLRDLDLELRETLKGLQLDDNKPSLSYGVAISYEKFPMAETRQRAEALLYEAKNHQQKNCIAWELRKHSGQTSGGLINKSREDDFESIIDLVSASFSYGQKFLHSVTFWLKRHEQALRFILAQDDRETLLWNFMSNNFNEGVHQRYQKYFMKIKALLVSVTNVDGPEEAIGYVHNILRYVEHIVSVASGDE